MAKIIGTDRNKRKINKYNLEYLVNRFSILSRHLIEITQIGFR